MTKKQRYMKQKSEEIQGKIKKKQSYWHFFENTLSSAENKE